LDRILVSMVEGPGLHHLVIMGQREAKDTVSWVFLQGVHIETSEGNDLGRNALFSVVVDIESMVSEYVVSYHHHLGFLTDLEQFTLFDNGWVPWDNAWESSWSSGHWSKNWHAAGVLRFWLFWWWAFIVIFLDSGDSRGCFWNLCHIREWELFLSGSARLLVIITSFWGCLEALTLDSRNVFLLLVLLISQWINCVSTRQAPKSWHQGFSYL